MVIRNGYAVLLFLEILAQTNHELQHEMMNRYSFLKIHPLSFLQDEHALIYRLYYPD